MRNLKDGIASIVSHALIIRDMLLEELTMEDSSIFFIIYNIYNDLLSAVEFSAELYIDDIILRSDSEHTKMLVIFIVSIVAIVSSIVVLFPVIRKVNSNRDEVLNLFLDIPKKIVRKLGSDCEKFMAGLQEGEDEGSVESENLDLEDQNQADSFADEMFNEGSE